MCFLVSSIPALIFFNEHCLFSFLGARKRSIGSFWERAAQKTILLNDLHDLILQIHYDLEYSSDFSIKCVPSWSSLNHTSISALLLLPLPRFLSIIHTRKSPYIPGYNGQLVTESWSSKPLNPCTWYFWRMFVIFVSCSVFFVFLSLRFWLYANSNEITWRMQHFALWFRSIRTSDFYL